MKNTILITVFLILVLVIYTALDDRRPVVDKTKHDIAVQCVVRAVNEDRVNYDNVSTAYLGCAEMAVEYCTTHRCKD